MEYNIFSSQEFVNQVTKAIECEPDVILMTPLFINQNPFNQGYNGLMNFVNSFILNKEINKKDYVPLDIVVKENVDFYFK